MKITRPAVLGSIILLVVTVAVGQQNRPPYKSIQPSAGRVFPAAEADLLELRDHPTAANVAQMRSHAWDLFVGLTDGNPAWETWYTKCDLKLTTGCPSQVGTKGFGRLIPNFEIPVQSLHSLEQFYAHREAPNAQELEMQSQIAAFQIQLRQFVTDFAEHPQFASVLFNKDAADHVIAHCLYPRSGNNQTSNCPPGTKESDIPAFERESIVIKTVWRVAHLQKGKHLAGPIDTWNSGLWNDVHAPGTDPNSFSKSVTINTSRGVKCENRDYADDEEVPLSCFYAHKLTQSDIKSFPHLLSAIDVHHLVRGDYLILAGMHVTTKEIPDWVWATFWWDNHAFSDRYSQGRPPALGQQWRHFLMDTTLSAFTPVEKDGGPKIVFNPYLETKITNGIISNCIQCHRLAAYGDRQKFDRAYDLGVLARDGKTLASGGPREPGYFDNLTKTDFLWSLSAPQDTLLTDVLNALQEMVKIRSK